MQSRSLAACLFLCLALVVSAYAADEQRSLALATKDLIYHPGTQLIFASVPSTGATGPNSITSIGPVTGQIVGAPIFVGSEPGTLALSDNGRYLYVALDGA